MKLQGPPTTAPGILSRLSRRDVLKVTGLAALTGTAGCGPSATIEPRIPVPTFESLGLRPFINCWGTITMLSGSLMLPEVKMAMMEASNHYIHIPKLMEAVGRRLSELTGAEWGCITSGAAGALVGATAACITGKDQKLISMLPDTTGMKNEVLVSSRHRVGYDRCVRQVGVTMIEVDSAEEMESKINDRTAMIFILGSGIDRGNISLEEMVSIGKKHGVPTLVDAAAERPDVPNIYIEGGVDLLCYSGGKCMRGPQASGVLLGRKDLIEAAFLNCAPHLAIGRPSKVGKEEIMGALTAVDMWVNGRDHDAEWKEWERMLNYISDAVSSISSVTTEIRQPGSRADHNPTLSISWDQNTVRIEPRQVIDQLLEGDPSIVIPGGRGGVSIAPYMMEEGDEIPVAKRLTEILSGAV